MLKVNGLLLNYFLKKKLWDKKKIKFFWQFFFLKIILKFYYKNSLTNTVNQGHINQNLSLIPMNKIFLASSSPYQLS